MVYLGHCRLNNLFKSREKKDKRMESPPPHIYDIEQSLNSKYENALFYYYTQQLMLKI